jgi:hypothetical protein
MSRFNSIGWTGYNACKGDAQAFLFSLKNLHGNGNIGSRAVCCAPNQGPRFGNGHDINAHNFSSSVSFNLSHTNTDSSGYGTNVFVGGSSGKIDDMEVWKL